MSETTCTNHCSHCGLHFHSVAAFDRHRIGDYASNDPETGRRCTHPIERCDENGAPIFETLTTGGACRIYPPYRDDVTVWTLAGSRERGRALRANAVDAEALATGETP